MTVTVMLTAEAGFVTKSTNALNIVMIVGRGSHRPSECLLFHNQLSSDIDAILDISIRAARMSQRDPS